MAGEFATVFTDENTSRNAVNAQNMHFIMPSLSCLGQNYLRPAPGQKRRLKVDAGTYVKMVMDGVHKVVAMHSDLLFDPQNFLDIGTSFQPGKDYSVYIVSSSLGADIRVSLNATYPEGATAQNSRRIGGFHTLCADVGSSTFNTALTGYIAGDILPNSIWDLKKGPECDPGGMVYNPETNIWVDIYMQSGSAANTSSVFQGTVTKSQTYDQHQLDMMLVKKRFLRDHEFTSAALGSPYGVVVAGAADPITTGGKVTTTGERIISNIGCEDMTGCYWQWGGETWYYTGSSYVTVAPGQGQQYGPFTASMFGGGFSDAPATVGPRCRYRIPRSYVAADSSARGCASNISRV